MHCHSYIAAGDDYEAINITLTFNPGSLMECVSINITDDNDVEPDQSFSISISDLKAPPPISLGTNVSANATILNDGKQISTWSDSMVYTG